MMLIFRCWFLMTQADIRETQLFYSYNFNTKPRLWGTLRKRSPQKDHVIDGRSMIFEYEYVWYIICWTKHVGNFFMCGSPECPKKCWSWESLLKFWVSFITDGFPGFASHFVTGRGAVVNLWVNGYCKSKAGTGSNSLCHVGFYEGIIWAKYGNS